MQAEAHSFTDTHTHLYYIQDEVLLSEMMARCKSRHVSRMLLPNVDVETISLVFDLQAKYPSQCFAMMGLHPCSVKDDYQVQLDTIYEAIKGDQRICAIGEIGLDLYWDKSTIDIQREAFRIQTQWAKELGLPVSIHCRDAYDELYDLLEEIQDGRLKGVLHCFTGNKEQAQRTIDYGLHLGIGGVVTFKNAGLDQVVKNTSLEYIVLETDSPYLAPSPHRGKQNESSFLWYIAEKVADLHGLSMTEVAKITTANAMRIFGLEEATEG